MADSVVGDVHLADASLDEIEIGFEPPALADFDRGVRNHLDAAARTVDVPLVIGVVRPGSEADARIHAVFDLDGVGEGAMGEHLHRRIVFNLHVEDDPLNASLRQHAKTEMDRPLDLGPGFEPEVRLDAVVQLVRVDFESRDQVRADDAVLVDFEARHVIGEHMAWFDSHRFQQTLDHFGVAHGASRGSGSLAWSHCTHRFSKYWPIRLTGPSSMTRPSHKR